MDLIEIRQQVVKLSGRFDLATTTVLLNDTDNGADFFINSGLRMLDKMFNMTKSRSSVFNEVAAAAWYLTFQNCSYIEEVWCNDTEGRWQLRKYPYQTIKENYSELVSASDGGKPLFYSPIWLRSSDITDYASLGTFFNYVTATDDGTYNAIVFAPKTDVAYNLEVIGKFMSVEFSDNDDENYWSVVLPDMLIMAALYKIEVFNRNSEGARDWMSSIKLEGVALEHELVMEESNGQRIVE